jgi:hypothetical protein
MFVEGWLRAHTEGSTQRLVRTVWIIDAVVRLLGS